MTDDNVIDLSEVFQEGKTDKTLREHGLSPVMILAMDEYGNFELLYDPEIEAPYYLYALEMMKYTYMQGELEE